MIAFGPGVYSLKNRNKKNVFAFIVSVHISLVPAQEDSNLRPDSELQLMLEQLSSHMWSLATE